MSDEVRVTANEEDNVEPVYRELHDDLTPQELEDVKTQFLERLKTSEQYMQTLYPSMISNYKKYCSIADAIKDEQGNVLEDRPNLFIPYPFAIVESEMPRLAGRLPRCRAFPRRDVDDEKVKKIQDLIYYAFDRMSFIGIQTLWIRQFAIYGWSPLYYFWRDESRTVLARTARGIPGTAEKAYPLQRVQKQVYDDFWATVLDVFDCFFQPGVERIEDGDYFFFREWYTAKDLKKMAKGGHFFPGVVEEYLKTHRTPMSHPSSEGRDERDALKGLTLNSSADTEGRYELMWMLEGERIVQLLDRDIIVKVGDNPNPLQELPIINCNLSPLVNEPIGVGTIESLAGLPDKLNALSNARLENIALLLGMVFLAQRNDAQTDIKNVKATSGNVILVGDVERSIKQLEVKDMGLSAEQEINETKQDLQFVSGISDYIVGTKSAAKLVDTATGVSTVVREANAKFALKLSTFETGSLRKLVEVCHAYNMTYMPEKKRIHILGPKGMETMDVNIDDILEECDFIVEPGSSVPLDQLSRREALVGLLDRVLRLPTVVKIDKFMKEVFESYDIRNVEDLLINQPGPQSALDDTKLAEAENVALNLGEDIPLVGNDGLHLGIHQSADAQTWTADSQARLADHIQQHQAHIQAVMQQQQQAQMAAAMMGGQPNGINAGGTGTAVVQPGTGNMGNATRIPDVAGIAA